MYEAFRLFKRELGMTLLLRGGAVATAVLMWGYGIIYLERFGVIEGNPIWEQSLVDKPLLIHGALILASLSLGTAIGLLSIMYQELWNKFRGH